MMDKTIEEGIKVLASNVDAAYNAGDAVKMAGYWLPNGLNLNPFGDAFEGRPNIEADLANALDGFMKGTRHNLSVEKVYLIDDAVVVADGIATISGIINFDGSKMEPLTSNFSMICTKENSPNWQIVQMRAYRFIPKQE